MSLFNLLFQAHGENKAFDKAGIRFNHLTLLQLQLNKAEDAIKRSFLPSSEFKDCSLLAIAMDYDQDQISFLISVYYALEDRSKYTNELIEIKMGKNLNVNGAYSFLTDDDLSNKDSFLNWMIKNSELKIFTNK